MIARFLICGRISFLLAVVMLAADCQRNEGDETFSATDMYGKWKCYKIYTVWKSRPDSMRVDTVDSLDNLYRITQDSILNYVKTAPSLCYRKSALAVEYTSGDTVDSSAYLRITAFLYADGIALKYYYRTADSIKEYCLQKIDTALTINVCRFGSTLLKAASRDTESGEPSAIVRRTALPGRNSLIVY